MVIRLKANGQSGGTGVRSKQNALLKGLIWCKSCGRPMKHSFSCKGNKQYRNYVCGTTTRNGWSKCPAPSVPAGEIQRFVVEQIQSIDTADDRRLLGSFEGLWETIQPREQVHIVKLLIDRVDFDGVDGNVAITFHDTGLQSLSTGERDVTA